MTKKLLFTLFLLLTSAHLTAQSLRFGLTAGVNTTQVKLNDAWKNVADGKTRVGWFVGPKVYLSTPLGIGAEAALIYSHRNMEITSNNLPTVTHSQSSIALPVSARFSFGLGSLVAAFINTGPQFNYRLQNKDWDLQSITSGKALTNIKSKKMRTSWNIGAGVRLLKHIEMSVGYNFSLSKYLEKTPYTNEYNFDINTYRIGVTYIF